MLRYQAEDYEKSLTFSETTVKDAIEEYSSKRDSERYAVYWLECHLPDFEYRDREAYQDVLSRCFRILDVEQTPTWLSSALRSDSVYYVGFTSSLSARIKAHISGDGAEFCQLFPPKELYGVWWFSAEKNARLAEQEKAIEIQKQIGNSYVFQY